MQPTIPFNFNDNLSLILRLTVPLLAQYNITGSAEKEIGLSDIVSTFLLRPTSDKAKLQWAVGSVMIFPSGTDPKISSEKFSIGPTAAIIKRTNGLTIGALAYQIWSVAGERSRADINRFFLFPFLIYNWKTGSGFRVNMEYTRNWDSKNSFFWVTPFLTALTIIGKRKLQIGIGPRFNLVAPNGSRANWGIRSSITLLPKNR
ncbi:hypothetical protein [Sediminitomix flava]|nr:hypothetical protein [Sediminitomix flava]